MILEGKTLAKQIRESLPERAQICKERLGRTLKLVGIGWAADYASYVYLKKELDAAQKTGVDTEIIDIDENTTLSKFTEIIKKVSADDSVDAVLIPKPLPKHLNTPQVWEALAADKDIDGASTLNMGRLFMCKSWSEVRDMEGFAPCTAVAVMRLLEFHNIELKGKEVAVLGRSSTVGKPLAHMISCKDATVKICHSRTADLTDSLKNESVIISAIGKARFLKEDMIPAGSIIVDVGTNQDENGVFCGDVDFDPVSQKAASVSPVPGGVGPTTLACLLENIIISGERKVNAGADK